MAAALNAFAHHVLPALDHLAPAWAQQIGRASLQGGALVLIVWLVCRMLPKLPPACRQGLWLLACVKMAVALVCAHPVALAVLKPAPLPPSIAATPALEHTRFIAPKIAPSTPSAAIIAPDSPPSAPQSEPSVTLVSPVNTPLTFGAALMLIYAAGVVLMLGIMAAAGARLRRLVRLSRPAGGTDTAAAIAECASNAGLRRAPRVHVSRLAGGPLVCGPWSPTIILPAAAGNGDARDEPSDAPALTASDLSIALAHEMAHIKRGDLWLAVVPAAARVLFWFHPLVWLAEREYRAAAEEACDAHTLRITGADPAEYFRVLLRSAEAAMAAGAHRLDGAAALGFSERFHSLRRRLDSLAHVSHKPASLALRIAAALVTVVCLSLLAPVRFTAHARGLVGDALPKYGLADLGTIDGRGSAANAINNQGTVVGELLPSRTRGPGHALVWQNGETVAIDPLPTYKNGMAIGINDRGTIIASAYNYARFHHAFVWSGGAQPLGILPGLRFTKAHGIDNDGDIVGIALTGQRRYGEYPGHAYISHSGAMMDIGTLGGTMSCAYAIDNRGDVVGKSDTARTLLSPAATHAFVWRGGTAMTDLGTLGGANSVAYAVNDSGVIAGAADVDGSVRHAALWYNGQVSDLGALAPDASSEAHAINRLGQVVGRSTLAAGDPRTHAVLWQSGRPIDLNSLLPSGSSWTLEEARGINDHGQIVGMGRLGGRKHAFVLSPDLSIHAR